MGVLPGVEAPPAKAAACPGRPAMDGTCEGAGESNDHRAPPGHVDRAVNDRLAGRTLEPIMRLALFVALGLAGYTGGLLTLMCAMGLAVMSFRKAWVRGFA